MRSSLKGAHVMPIFVMGDLHLSTDKTTNKSMEKFGKRWLGYTDKIRRNWEAVVAPEDTVVIPGDISWAMKLEESLSDFRFIESLPGNKLIGTVIVGTGLQAISNERNILRDYYETTRERGFDYAYTYPGINRVLQAAGRVIRREEDRGVIVLIDDRYETPLIRDLLPDHWKDLL